MKHQKSIIILSLVCCQAAMAQQTLTVNDCMRYAVDHNHDVRISQLTHDNRRADRVESIGAFLPQVSGQIGVQYNFGRAIDPETNTYTDVSTFYNGYSVQATLPVFDGFQRLNQLRATKASLLMGSSQMQAQQDELCLQVFESYCNVLYYQGATQMAKEQREQSRMTLRQTQLMAEVGQKSEADVAQMEALLATDDYEVTRQENELKTAEQSLKQLMNWPSEEPLSLSASVSVAPLSHTPESYSPQLPALHAAEVQVDVARYQLWYAKGDLSPSLSIGGGVNTSYNKMLHSEATSFREQLKNNLGEFVYATVSIPLFNRLRTISNIRRQRNNLRIAEEELAKKRDELAKLQLQAENDCEGYRKQTLQMQKKVEADSLAYRLTMRKYEEGLASSIDVQTTSATLLQAKTQLLQCQLMYVLKQKILNYYKGISLWTE